MAEKFQRFFLKGATRWVNTVHRSIRITIGAMPGTQVVQSSDGERSRSNLTFRSA